MRRVSEGQVVKAKLMLVRSTSVFFFAMVRRLRAVAVSLTMVNHMVPLELQQHLQPTHTNGS